MSNQGFQRILVATDGSEPANAAVDVAASLARSSGAVVRVVHAWSLEIHHRHSSSDAAVRLEAERLIGEAVDRLRRAAVQAEGQLAHADGHHVAAVIAEVARQFHPDLLVVGSRGLSDWRALVEHSVSHQLIAALDCPLLMVRARPARSEGGPLRVLVAIGAADDVDRACKAASAAAAVAGSKVLVVHVTWSVTTEHGVSYAEPREVMQRSVDRAVEALEDEGIAADSWLLREGPVAEVVADAASRWQADLIVLGSSRLGDVGSMLFGSVTHDLLRESELPVLVGER